MPISKPQIMSTQGTRRPSRRANLLRHLYQRVATSYTAAQASAGETANQTHYFQAKAVRYAYRLLHSPITCPAWKPASLGAQAVGPDKPITLVHELSMPAPVKHASCDNGRLGFALLQTV